MACETHDELPDSSPLALDSRQLSLDGSLELEMKSFEVHVTTAPGVLRTRIVVDIVNPYHPFQAEAVLRVAVPAGAAVTGAVLHVEGKPMPGAFVSRSYAQAIYDSIVRSTRDPMIVSWAGPRWLDVRIFPVEPGPGRRFEIEWVEPAAGQHSALYAVPSISGHRPTRLTMDGTAYSADVKCWALAFEYPDAALVVSQGATELAWMTGSGAFEGRTPPAAQLWPMGAGRPPSVAGVDSWRVLDTAAGHGVWIGRLVGPAPAGSVPGAITDLAALWSRARVKDVGNGELYAAVLMPDTALLVLEKEDDYRRWRIAPPRPAAKAPAGSVLAAVQGDGRDLFAPPTSSHATTILVGFGHMHREVWYMGGPARRIWRPRLRLGPVHLRGGNAGVTAKRSAKAVMRRYIERKDAQLTYCYEERLLARPDLEGTLIVSLDLDAEAQVARASAHGIDDQELQECTVSVLRWLRLPASLAGMRVRMSMHLDMTHGGWDRPAPVPPCAVARVEGEPDLVQRLASVPADPGRRAVALGWQLVHEHVRRRHGVQPCTRLLADFFYRAGEHLTAFRLLSEVTRFDRDQVQARLAAWAAPDQAMRMGLAPVLPLYF
jgi:hypothetical protein